jgi:hypothetical protein
LVPEMTSSTQCAATSAILATAASLLRVHVNATPAASAITPSDHGKVCVYTLLWLLATPKGMNARRTMSGANVATISSRSGTVGHFRFAMNATPMCPMIIQWGWRVPGQSIRLPVSRPAITPPPVRFAGAG